MIGLRTPLQAGVEQHVVDGEEGRRERPIDDAGDRFRPKEPHPARDLAEIDCSIFVEDRIGGEVAEPAPVEAIVDVGVGPELGDHDLKLGRVEIPSERAGDEASEQEPERIEPPARQLRPPAAQNAPAVEAEIDAAVSKRADRGHRKEARSSVIGGKIDEIGEREAKADNRPPREASRIAIGAPEPAEERRRAVGAAEDRRAQGKKKRAAEWADDQHAAAQDRLRAPRAQDEGGDQNEAYEQRAIDRALDETGPPMLPNRLETRRARAKPIEHDAGEEINDRPKARLSEGGAGAGENNRKQRLNDPLSRIGDERAQGRDRAAQRKQPMRARRSRQTVDADDVDQRQDRFANPPQDERAPDRDLDGKRQLRPARDHRAQAGHAPVGADRNQEVEQKRNCDQAHRLDEPQSASGADERHDRTAGVDDQCDRRPRRVEAPDVRPGAGQLPETKRIIALNGEDRERRGVKGDQRRGIRPLGPRKAQERQARSAGESGEHRLLQRDRGVKPKRQQRRAAERRKRNRPARKRARKGGRHLHAFRLPDSPSRLPCGLLTESQARVLRLPAAP